MKYYDGTKLLSMKDLQGRTPAMFMCTSNRSAGKTTFFTRLCVKKFIEGKGKFMVLYRYKYELVDCASKFFKEINQLFFPEYSMSYKNKAGGMYSELFLEHNNDGHKTSCGYVVAINSADGLKKYSHLFADTERILFDEFQSEQNNYCENEINKFISIYTTVARGNGQQSRYVPVYMLANNVTVLNPYYSELGISERLKPDTNFLRGNGWVLEQGFNESASNELQNSTFMSAFKGNMTNYITGEKVYLYSDTAFIEKMCGVNRYLCTIKVDNNEFAIREYENGIYYCNDIIDKNCLHKISVTALDHNINYVMLSRFAPLTEHLRRAFDYGQFRFKNETCKNAVLSFLRII